ncbi:ArsR/SmtB family transcription factor [Nonomuraea sp. SYSU D8015]|uniref:ArsR/SmtB family transcription factor n=1 Tax=Nonomuraea sp. SYSU D8015 TaxID=2593644 RepID=UPI003FA5398E
MHAFDILGDPVRRRILELLADGEQTSGAITEIIRAEFAISQPAVSQHLRCCVTAGSRRCGLRVRAGSTPSSPSR